MKKSTKITSVILTGVMVASMLGGCSSKDKPVEQSTSLASTTIQQSTSAESTTKAVVTSISAKDNDQNTLTLTPIYNKDGRSIVAGYVVKAKSKDGKELDAKAYSMLNRVVELASDKGNVKLGLDANKKLKPIKAYANTKGNLVAIEDANDFNGDKNKNEVLKLKSEKKENGTIYVIENKAVTIKRDGDKLFMIDGKDKTEVKEIGVESKDKKQATSTTKKGQTTTAAKPKPVKIVLKKNSRAECSSKKVEIKTAKVIIKDAGDYTISSDTDTWHGQIEIKLPNTKKANIKFKDVNISYNSGNVIRILDTNVKNKREFLEREVSSTEEALDNELKEISENDKAPNVDLSFPEGTHSSFKSTANNYSGVLYNESKLTIKGKGKVSIQSGRNADTCICSSKSITVKNCSIDLKTEGFNLSHVMSEGAGSAKGIFSYNKVTVESGNLKINTNGDAIRATRFISKGGSVEAVSSACDALDITKEITINGGKVTARSAKKSALKVRRINVADPKKPGVFKINGGTVIAEGKKSSSVQSSSKQASITAMIKKQATGDKMKYGTPAKISIKKGDDTVKSSSIECTTFIYSSSGINSAKSYKIKANSTTADVTFNGKAGTASIQA